MKERVCVCGRGKGGGKKNPRKAEIVYSIKEGENDKNDKKIEEFQNE